MIFHRLSDPFIYSTQPPCGRRCRAGRSFAGNGERMSVTAREVSRAVLIVLLSHDSRTVLLEHPSGGAAWVPLRVDTPSHQSFTEVVNRWQQDHSGGSGMCRGSVTGRMMTVRDSALSDFYVSIVKLSRPEAPDRFSPSARWWPVADLDSVQTFPLELGALVKGYVEGWIPDGPITLDA